MPSSELTTDRLHLRTLREDDAGFILRLLNDPTWLRHIGDRGVHNIDDARRYITHGPVARITGDGVIVLIGAANRDPERFERPDDFDIALPRRASLAFGSGPHVCIGAALTRLEGEIMLGQLARRWPHLALARPETPDWVPDQPLYRGLRSLPLWLQGPPA